MLAGSSHPSSTTPRLTDFRLTLRLALPLIFAEVGWMSMGVVDTIMVGRLPDSAIAIGATGLGQSLYHAVAIVGSGLLLGMDTFVSQAYGREDLHDARNTLLNGVVLALVLTPILMLAVACWPALMRRFGISPGLVVPMRPFLMALNWGTLPLLGYFALRRYLQAVNVALPITFALISANIVNAVGDWVLIYGHWGFRAEGITGSGWSTCIARVYMLLVLAITLVWVERRRVRSLQPGSLQVEAAKIWALLKLGSPAAGQILVEIGAFSGATALCAKLGPIPLSGHEIALNCAAFTFMVPYGISSAAAVRVGQHLGKREPEGARRAGWSAISLGVGFMACTAIVFVSIPKIIARAFSPDPAVIDVGAGLLLVAAAFQLFDGIQVVTTGALRGAGDTKTPMFANLIAYWLIGIPLGSFLCFRLGWGALGIWLGLCAGLIIVGSTLLTVWRKRKLPISAAVQAAN
ncbi:MAG TPA: MATE family efflux transporter [Terriglobales bacterium]|nr:MATE family efflux transporter [Terriglobales bacterium]